MLIFTHYSFVGYSFDIVLPILLIVPLFILLYKNETMRRTKNILSLYTIILITSYVAVGVNSIANIGMFSALNSFDVSGFYYYKVDNNFYNGYFEPVGAYSGGEGNIWISKTPLFFPIIEKTVYQEHAVMWDYSTPEFDGQKVDQRKIMKQTILDNLNID